MISYYSVSPKFLHQRSIAGKRFEGPVSRPYAFNKDWDLLPWVESGKLKWLDLDQDDLPLKSGPIDDFPYANIEGRRENFTYRAGKFRIVGGY
jgi:hypothetical protein